MPLEVFKQAGCFRYHKGTDFQANHNRNSRRRREAAVVLDTTKVQIFKQITTVYNKFFFQTVLFQIPQRYRFSSKSQQGIGLGVGAYCCFRYHKGTDFQANHNVLLSNFMLPTVVLDTTKVQIFKQITTDLDYADLPAELFQIPQRYRFLHIMQKHADKGVRESSIIYTTNMVFFK